MSTSTSRTSAEVGNNLAVLLEHLQEKTLPVFHPQYKHRIEHLNRALEPREISRLLQNIGDDLDLGQFSDGWRFNKYRFNGLLRQVNKELVSEGMEMILDT